MGKHVAVWIDHKEARIFSLHREGTEETTIAAPLHVHNKHSRGREGDGEHPDDAKHFFHEIVGGVEESEAILLLGPGTAKLHFLRYLRKHDHALEAKIVGIETVDHPTDGQALAYAKKYFVRREQLQ